MSASPRLFCAKLDDGLSSTALPKLAMAPLRSPRLSCTRPSRLNAAERLGARFVARRASRSARSSSPDSTASRVLPSSSATLPSSSLTSSSAGVSLLAATLTSGGGTGASGRTSGFGRNRRRSRDAPGSLRRLGLLASSDERGDRSDPDEATDDELEVAHVNVSFRSTAKAAVVPAPKCAPRAALSSGVANWTRRSVGARTNR